MLPSTAPSLPQRIIDAALLGCLLTALAFQSIRFEPYEAEKSGLLLLFAAILLGALLLRRPSLSAPLFRQPLTVLLVALLLLAGLSTAVALSPSMSFWGSPYRSQGWLSVLSGLLVFLAAANASSGLRHKMSLLLCLIVIPLCLLAWAAFLKLDTTFPVTDRPSATTGNVNFLANWLAAALILIFPLLTVPGRLCWLALGTSALTLATLVMTVSRSALLSLLVAVMVGCVLWGALTHRRWVLVLLGLVALAGMSAFLLAGQITSSRLFILDDPVRLSIWADGVSLTRQMNLPLTDVNGAPDRWAELRPLLGYGLDNLEQTYPRLGATLYYLSSWLDRFHNLFLDNLLSLGWPGLLLQLGVYAAALYSGLSALGLLPNRRQVLLWLVTLLFGAALGGLVTAPLAADTNEYRAIAVVAVGLGVVGGFVLWGALRILFPSTPALTRLSSRQWFILALLTFIVQQWLVNQFHFQTVIGQPLWWIALGLLARESLATPSSIDDAPSQESAIDQTALVLLPPPGLLLLNTLGPATQNTFLNIQIGEWFTSILLTVIVTAIGWFAFCPPRRSLRPTLLLLAGDWLVVTVLRTEAGKLAEYALQNLLPLPLLLAAGLLSLIGVGTVALVLVCLTRQPQTIPVQSDQLPLPTPSRRWIIATVVVLLGILLYAVPFTGSALQKISDQVGASHLPAAQMSADLALLYSPVVNRVYFGRAYLLLGTNLPDRITRAREEINHLTQNEPFMTNSREIYELLEYMGN